MRKLLTAVLVLACGVAHGQAISVANPASLNSPVFTGTPTAPTAATTTNTTQIATTAFDQSLLASPPAIGSVAPNTGTFTSITNGNGTANSIIVMNGSASTSSYRRLFWQSGGINRWSEQINDAETGSNTGSNWYLFSHADNGAPNQYALMFNRASNAATFTGTVSAPAFKVTFPSYALSGSATNQPGAFYVGNVTGASTTGQGYYQFQVDDDSSTVPSAADLAANYGFGGLGVTGSIIAENNTLSMKAATNQAAEKYYIAQNNNANFTYNAGGTGTSYSNSAGSLYGINDTIALGNGATNYNEIVGEEIDSGILSGGSAAERVNLRLTLNGSNVQGAQLDDMIDFLGGQGATVGSNYGLVFGSPDGEFPISGTIIGTGYTQVNSPLDIAAQNGINFSAVKFSGDAWQSAGAKIDPLGDYLAGPGAVSWSASGVKLSSAGQVAGVAGGTLTPVAGGTEYKNGSTVTTGNGDLYTVTASGGIITSLTIVVPASSQGAPPANPLMLYGDRSGHTGTPATVNLTWTPATTTTIGQSGGMVAIASTETLASYTVSTLPTCNASLKNGLASVTDATSPTYNGALTGGGAVNIPVFCNGTAWTAH